MINESSLRAVAAASFDRVPDAIRPLSDFYCFANIPQTISMLLTGAPLPGMSSTPLPPDVLGESAQRYDCVILFLIDALGWRFLAPRLEHDPFLQRFVREGVVSQLTTQFPSTTAAHVTTIHTGFPVGESGIFEWFYYEPLVDDIIAPLLFSFSRDRVRDGLSRTGVAPERFYPTTTIYQHLQQHGISSYVSGHSSYAQSPYSQIVTDGATPLLYNTLSESLVNLADHMLTQRTPAYYLFYYGGIDSICHEYGPDAPQTQAEIDLFLMAAEHIFYRALAGKYPQKTLLLLTADHGQIAINPKETIYLNQLFPRLERYLKTNRTGQLLVPAGSSRDMFLYINDDDLDEAIAYLRDGLAGRATVHRVADLQQQGIFGSAPISETLSQRLGNLLILPNPNESVWWYEPGLFESRFLGHHGGLTREEMEIGLLALPCS